MNTGRSRTSAAAAPRAYHAMMRGDGRRRALLAAQEMRPGRRLVALLVGRLVRWSADERCCWSGVVRWLRANLRTALHRAMAAAEIFVGGGRRPAAAPACLRRCRDG
ncbi:hypothetical protein F511_45707 [Dorcoceras hygrometricum]|uniref:Uncharacterized protein n=1 Tax=Dorcoceras hygrometricum TaxID=472368 RepID=A0A2Z7A2T0_9LAMI|nr:hypothetical protein F511_45707 [Dorcoceras hygrometricum]